jgi:23S rRNA (adenine2503-C2)-methyltransferase
LLSFLEEHDFNPAAATRIWKHFLKNPQSNSFHDIPALPKGLYDLLEKNFAILSSTVDTVSRSSDGTVKLLIRMQDGNLVEVWEM